MKGETKVCPKCGIIQYWTGNGYSECNCTGKNLKNEDILKKLAEMVAPK